MLGADADDVDLAVIRFACVIRLDLAPFRFGKTHELDSI